MNELQHKSLAADMEESQRALLKEMESASEFQNKQNTIRIKMQENRKRKLLPIFLLLLPFISFLFPGRLFLLVLFIAVSYFFLRYRSGNNKDFDNDFLYSEHFLCPVLKVAYPTAVFSYQGGIDLNILKYILPRTDRYEAGRYIQFHDHDHLEVCNVYAHHTEIETDNERTNREEVTDFIGQVYAVRYPSAVNGYIRIVPAGKMQVTGSQVNPYYFHFDDGSVKIETEDIQNNERYAITCTDELAARKFLNPAVLKWLDEQIEVPVSIYITQEHLYFALYTGKKIFCAPSNKEGIDNLSLTGVYKSLQQEMNKTKELINALHIHA